MRWEESGRVWRLIQRRVEKIIQLGGEKIAGNTSPVTKGKDEERERSFLWWCLMS